MTDNELEKLCVQISELYTQHNVGGFCVVVSPESTKAMVSIPGWTTCHLNGDNEIIVENKKEHEDIVLNKVQNTMYFFYMVKDFFNYVGSMFDEAVPKFNKKYEKEIKIVTKTPLNQLH